AKQELLRRLEDEARNDAAALARDLKEQARRSADKEAKKILALAIQRLAPESTAETTVSAVALPSDEMKGRIIGREGRNIRAFEAATGVDVIIDDTPDTVVVSCFDPVRREVARVALERLIADGRIHPGRIEEVAHKAQAEVEAGIAEAGEQAAYETGIHGLHADQRDRAGGGRGLGLAAGGPARGVRDLRQAPHPARAARRRVPGRREGVRDSSGARGAGRRDAQRHRRRPGGRAVRPDRPQDRARAAISRADQGRRRPRDARGGFCPLDSSTAPPSARRCAASSRSRSAT